MNSANRKNENGFTLIELLVVIAIIAILSAISIVQYESYRQRARDTHRISDINSILIGLEAFFVDNDRYPGASFEGVSTSGEVVGDGAGAFDTAMLSYLGNIPADPLYAEDPSNYYYAYDPVHLDCLGDNAVAIAFRRSEGMGFISRDTDCGGDLDIDVSDYNKILYPSSP